MAPVRGREQKYSQPSYELHTALGDSLHQALTKGQLPVPSRSRPLGLLDDAFAAPLFLRFIVDSFLRQHGRYEQSWQRLEDLEPI